MEGMSCCLAAWGMGCICRGVSLFDFCTGGRDLGGNIWSCRGLSWVLIVGNLCIFDNANAVEGDQGLWNGCDNSGLDAPSLLTLLLLGFGLLSCRPSQLSKITSTYLGTALPWTLHSPPLTALGVDFLSSQCNACCHAGPQPNPASGILSHPSSMSTFPNLAQPEQSIIPSPSPSSHKNRLNGPLPTTMSGVGTFPSALGLGPDISVSG